MLKQILFSIFLLFYQFTHLQTNNTHLNFILILADDQGWNGTSVKMINDNEDLSRLILSPTFTYTDQISVMNEIFKKQDVSVLVKNLVNVLIRNRRINLLVSIINAYDHIMKSNSGEIIAEVITAVELKDDQKQEIISNLKKMTGKEIQIQSIIEPEIIAGIKVKIGSQMIDASVSTKLNNLKILMKGAN